MTDTVRAQVYLAIGTGEADGLPGLLGEAGIACVRLAVEGEGDVPVAVACRAYCHERDIPLLIAAGDELAIAVARESGADGVHLTGSPKAAPWVREQLGEDVIVGIDPGPSRHDALIAAETGADYVSLAEDWPEDGGVPAEIVWWSQMIETPMVVENAGDAARAGLLREVAEFVVTDAGGAKALAAVLA
jgi:thiamine-phosphate pyrophosphorylase